MNWSTTVVTTLGILFCGCTALVGLDNEYVLTSRGSSESSGSSIDFGSDGGVEEAGLAPGTVVWNRTFGADGSDRGDSVAVDSSGNVFLMGKFSGGVDFDGSILSASQYGNFVLMKLDQDGQLIWAKGFPGSVYDGQHIVATNQNVIIAGSYYQETDLGGGPLPPNNSGIFIASFDSDGNHLWSKGFGNGYVLDLNSIAADHLGNIAIVGQYGGSIGFGGDPLISVSGDSDVFIAKFDINGVHLWSKSLGGNTWDYGFDIAIDSHRDIVVVGAFDNATDLGTGPIQSLGGVDAFIVKLDGNTGLTNWSKTFGGELFDWAKRVAIGVNDDIAVAGTFSGTASFGGEPVTSLGTKGDIFLLQLNTFGEHHWSRSYGGAGREKPTSLLTSASGGLVLASAVNVDEDPFAEPPIFEADMSLAQFGDNGVLLWDRTVTAQLSQQWTSVASNPEGSLLVTGFFDGEINLGTGLLKTSGNLDIVIAKVLP